MNFIDLVAQTRTCRRFRQSASVSPLVVRGLVDLGRLAACAGNLQPLKYILSATGGTLPAYTTSLNEAWKRSYSLSSPSRPGLRDG